MNYIKIAASMLGIIIGLFVINEYVVSEAELQEFEIKTVQTLELFQKEMVQQNDFQRLDRLKDDYLRYKLQLAQDPTNDDIRADLEITIEKIGCLKDKLGLE